MGLTVRKIGSTAYELELPPNSWIHPVFHISQFKKAREKWESNELPAHNSDDLEMSAIPEEVLTVRYDNSGVLEVLIMWEDLSPAEATWDLASVLDHVFTDFYLEEKVKLQTEVYFYAFHQRKNYVTWLFGLQLTGLFWKL